MEKSLEKLIKEAAREGKLPCAVAFKLAEDHKIPLAKIGQAANDAGVKIKTCQLGCFE